MILSVHSRIRTDPQADGRENVPRGGSTALETIELKRDAHSRSALGIFLVVCQFNGNARCTILLFILSTITVSMWQKNIEL